MSVEVFDLAEFKDTLDQAHEGDWTWSIHGGEYRYSLEVHDRVYVHVNSSVSSSTGWSEGTGENSIRVWLGDRSGKPYGNKIQTYTTRLPGWQERMTSQVQEMVRRAYLIGECSRCGSVEKIFQVKKANHNKGRLFRRCNCPKSFAWLTDREGNIIPSAARDNHDMVVEELEQTESPVHEFIPSHYQQAIFDYVQNEQHHLVVEALAGSGKTTTGVEMLKLLRGLKVLFVAFNRHVVKDIKTKAPYWVQISTYHSLGFRACKDAYGKDVLVEKKKVYHILQSLMDKQVHGHLFSTIKKVVSLVKATLCSTDWEELDHLCDHFGIELNGDRELIFEAVEKVIVRSAAQTNVIDYDDMCWLPVYHDLPMRQHDLIFVDEAQDTNRVQIALALKSVRDTGRIIAVGDRYQSMYGFRGADAEAVPNLVSSLDADCLPLSITYRNPKSVVRLVNERFPEIPLEAWDKAPEGEVRYMNSQVFTREVQSGDMVLCRTNAPLVSPCYRLIAAGKKATIRGRDIGEGLVELIDKVQKKWSATNLESLLRCMALYRDDEVRKLLAAEKNIQAQAVQDKVDTVVAIANGCTTVLEVQNRILDIFSDTIEGVVFSTVHRAKGLEADNVFILESGLMPHPMASKPWELEQERNIEYVALTRAKQTLTFVN